MRISKVFSAIFGVLGLAVLVLALMLALGNLDGAVYMDQVPEGASASTEKLMEALSVGDYAAAEACLYGDGGLGAVRQAAGAEGQLVWQAFMESFTYEFAGPCYGAGNGICRDVTITTLNIPSISAKLTERTQTILDQRIKDAQEVNNLDLVYDEEGKILDSVVSSILATALEQALAEDAQTQTYTVTLELVNEDGSWQVIPSEELLKAVSGGL